MKFNGGRLRIIRRFHNLTQRDLGEKIGSTASTITNYERWQAEPKGINLDALCAVLNVDRGFFFSDGGDDEFQEHQTNFRSLKSAPERTRNQMLAHATLFGVLLKHLSSKVKLPPFRLPDIRADTPAELEAAAERCRVELGVGADAPIKDVLQMVEHAGVVTTVLNQTVSAQLDAFSRYGETNLIVLNPAKGSPTRARMNGCHETGHGVLHRHGIPTDLGAREQQANFFAGALLLPQKSFGREFWTLGKSPSWEALLELKKRWGANVAAIIVRAYQLGHVDAAEYQRRFKSMQRMGWLKGDEPFEPEPEQPHLFSLVLNRYQTATGKSTAGIAQDLNWTPDLFEQITCIPTRPDDGPTVKSFDEFRRRKTAAE